MIAFSFEVSVWAEDPCIKNLFLQLKRYLCDQQFRSDDDGVKHQAQKWLRQQEPSFYQQNRCMDLPLRQVPKEKATMLKNSVRRYVNTLFERCISQKIK